MKNLRTYLLALFSTVVFALPVFGSDTIVADTARFRPLKRPFIMSLTFGKQFHTGGRPDALLFGDRKSVNTEMSLRMAGFFQQFRRCIRSDRCMRRSVEKQLATGAGPRFCGK